MTIMDVGKKKKGSDRGSKLGEWKKRNERRKNKQKQRMGLEQKEKKSGMEGGERI